MVAQIALALVLSATDPKDTYKEYVSEICEQYENIDPEVIEAMIEKESSWDAGAVSRSGAIGLMQIIPKWQGDRMEKLEVTDISDPYSNILIGVDYLAELIDMFEDVTEALMVYNAGWAGVDLYRQGYVSKYAHDILIRSFEIREEKTDGKRNYDSPAGNLIMRL